MVGTFSRGSHIEECTEMYTRCITNTIEQIYMILEIL